MLDLVWLVPAFPLAGFLILTFGGRRLGEPTAGWLATGAMVGSFLATAGAFYDLTGRDVHDRRSVTTLFEWVPAADLTVDVGFLADPLSLTMCLFVTGVGALIHLYSIGYMHGDERYPRFFAYMNLFIGSMLTLVLADNFALMFVGWELVGACSYLLISFWFTDEANASAGKKAFITNRIGDWGFMLAIFMTFATFGTVAYVDVLDTTAAGTVATSTATFIALMLFVGAIGKSAQFPLFLWLPDAMAGPTPVSALIHAATMVTSGIYLLTRVNPIIADAADWVPTLIAWTGAGTALFAATIAVAQRDIKKVLAYSTISQLGYMFLAVGCGAYVAAVFHMVTHAFFKALLFLGSGSVIHGMDGDQDMAHYGGLRRLMPVTAGTFVIGWLAIAGVPPFAGFWSKDEILVGTGGWGLLGGTGGNGAYTLMLGMGMLTAALTAAYMTRCVYLTFFGEFRGHGEPHESGPRIIVPLWILAGLAIVVGFLNLPTGFQLAPGSLQERFGHYVEPVAGYFPAITHATPSWSLAIVSTLVVILGIAASGYYYFVKVEAASKAAGTSLTELPDGPTSRYPLAAMGYKLLDNKYYLDHLYSGVIANGTKGPLARLAYRINQQVIDRTVDVVGETAVKAGTVVYDKIDQLVVDGAVNASGRASSGMGEELRRVNSGKVQSYAAILFAAATVLAGLLIVIV